MPTWAWVLLIIFGSLGALLGLLALGLALFRIRYFLEWRGAWDGSLSGSSAGTALVEFGFPGFKRTWEPLKDESWTLADLIGDEDDEDDSAKVDVPAPRNAEEEPVFLKATPFDSVAPETVEPERERKEEAARPQPDAPGSREEKKKRDPNRMRRTLFRLVTDRDAWKLLSRFGLKIGRLVLKLLRPRIEAAIGHPDPAFLGRLAGKWYAVRPLLPTLGPKKGRIDLYFRFQDVRPTLWVRVEGRFSALTIVTFGIRLLFAFPSIRLARRALHSWRRHRLSGWRAWVYRKLQPARQGPH